MTREGWVVGHLVLVVLSSFTFSLQVTDRAGEEMDGVPTHTCGPLLLSGPSERKTNRARREKGWVANSNMGPFPFQSLLEGWQTGLGEGWVV